MRRNAAMTAQHTFAFVNDELKTPLAQTLAFARENGVQALEIRSIEGRNFLALSQDEQKDVARQVADAGIKVVGLASPLLKWAAPGRIAGRLGDQFGFEIGSRSLGDIARLTADAAHRLGTRNVRIFSFLTHEGFELADLDAALDELLALAEREDLVFHVENEPVCNIQDEVDLMALMQARRHPRLKALLDIGNIYAKGVVPDAARMATLMPFVDHMHFKDFSIGAGRRHVAVGEGDVPYGAFIKACLAAAPGRALTLSVETHVPDDPVGATRRSLIGLRNLVAAATA
jgi:sugar phosphate isomerase/epimerase